MTHNRGKFFGHEESRERDLPGNCTILTHKNLSDYFLR